MLAVFLTNFRSQVWEIEGAEFTYSPKHTANAISIRFIFIGIAINYFRFPRVTKIRYDKDWESATNLRELKVVIYVKNS